MITFDELSPGPDGLVPAIVQDAATGEVAMMAWMNAEALDRTQETGFVHFWSRSRDELWKKGATSGSTLDLRAISADCDGDALLVIARTSGPVCHTGRSTCFDTDARPDVRTLGGVVDTLTRIIDERRTSAPDQSYSARLIGDPDLAARKVLEEAGEVAFAVKDLPDGGTDRVRDEAADVVYHLLALLASVDVGPAEVAAELARRMTEPPGDAPTRP